MRIGRLAALGIVLLLVGGCDETSKGAALYEDGRYEEALAAFDEAVEAAGERASAALLYDQALAALRVGRFAQAEAAARRAAAARGGEAIAPLCDFVRGNAAFLRSEAAEAEARRPDGEPTARQWALASAEDALAAWRRAAATREDWPEARRNVERALLRLRRLQEERAGGRGRIDLPSVRPDPVAPRPEPPAARPDPDLESTELSPEEVLGLMTVLREKERQKQEVRRAERRARADEVEKDW